MYLSNPDRNSPARQCTMSTSEPVGVACGGRTGAIYLTLLETNVTASCNSRTTSLIESLNYNEAQAAQLCRLV